MNKPAAIMLRSIAAFIAAVWCAIIAFILFYFDIVELAIIAWITTAFFALVSWLDYHHAEELAKDYDDDY